MDSAGLDHLAGAVERDLTPVSRAYMDKRALLGPSHVLALDGALPFHNRTRPTPFSDDNLSQDCCGCARPRGSCSSMTRPSQACTCSGIRDPPTGATVGVPTRRDPVRDPTTHPGIAQPPAPLENVTLPARPCPGTPDNTLRFVPRTIAAPVPRMPSYSVRQLRQFTAPYLVDASSQTSTSATSFLGSCEYFTVARSTIPSTSDRTTSVGGGGTIFPSSLTTEATSIVPNGVQNTSTIFAADGGGKTGCTCDHDTLSQSSNADEGYTVQPSLPRPGARGCRARGSACMAIPTLANLQRGVETSHDCRRR